MANEVFSIEWQDEVGLSIQLTETERALIEDVACEDARVAPSQSERKPFSLEECAKAWGIARKRYSNEESPSVMVSHALSEMWLLERESLETYEFWTQLKLDAISGEKATLDFDQLVDPRWRDSPKLSDEETRRELVGRLAAWLSDGRLDGITSTSYYATWYHRWAKLLDALLPPGEFVSMLIANGLRGVPLGGILEGLAKSTWERRLANGDALEALGDAFYETLDPAWVQTIFTSAPNPRAARAHYERLEHDVGFWFVLDVLDDGDDDHFLQWCEVYHAHIKANDRGYYSRKSELGKNEPALRLLVRLGPSEESIEHFTRLLADFPHSYTHALRHVHAPWPVSHWYEILQKKSLSNLWPAIEEWLLGEGANAVAGLVSLAERRGKRRTFAIEWLQKYVEAGHTELVEQSIDRAPEKIATLLREQVLAPATQSDEPATTTPAGDPTLAGALSDRLVKAKDILELEDAPEGISFLCNLEVERHIFQDKDDDTDIAWPLVRLRGKKRALSAALVKGVCDALIYRNRTYQSFPSVKRLIEQGHWGGENPELAEAFVRLREECDAEDLDALWCFLHDAKVGAWIWGAVREIGGPRAITIAGSKLRNDQHREHLNDESYPDARLIYGLYFQGSHEAWAQIVSAPAMAHGRARNNVFDSAVEIATAKIAEASGWTVSQCRARLVPTLGLDAKASISFDYGKRIITLRVDPSLQILLEDDKGKSYRSVPSARKGEDSLVVEQHKQSLKWLREVLQKAIEDARMRFELEMARMHTRTLEALRHEVLDHPWQRHFVRSLVWGHYVDGVLEQTFLCDEDGSLVDADFDAVDLPEDAMVALVHPIELTDQQILAWEQALADSEIIQPLQQLERPTYPTQMWEDERKWLAEELSWREYTSSKLVKLLGWERHDTPRRGGMYGGHIWYCAHAFPTLGLRAGYLYYEKQWRVKSEALSCGLYFFKDDDDERPENVVPWEDVPARAVSELLVDLHAAAEKE